MTENLQSSALDHDNIDDLLDSALEDFDNLPTPASSTKAQKQQHAGQTLNNDRLSMFENSGVEQNNVRDLKSELDRLMKVSSECESPKKQQPGSSTIQDTLKKMSEDSCNLGGEPSEEEMNKMFENLGMRADGDGDIGKLLPMMEGMMQSLLSKDLLYPAMKDMSDKFPDWLADNRSNIGQEEFDKYNKQYDITRRICYCFEEENDADSEADKKARFDKIMGLMQDMQQLGHPPKELVGDMPAGVEFDAMGQPILPGVPDQCVVS